MIQRYHFEQLLLAQHVKVFFTADHHILIHKVCNCSIKMLKAPTRITLKNQTKMSLNARFTSIMKSRPPATAQTVKAHVSTEKLASEKNRRLALQMENRHAATENVGHVTPTAATKVSIRERLGSGGGGSIRGRLTLKRGTSGRSPSASRGRGGVRRGGVQRQNFSARGGKKFGSSSRGARGGFQKRGFRGRRGGARGGGNAKVDKSTLDSDLDSYMSKTKGSMDAELDAYMANAGDN